jgi:hypothetical protein
MDSFLASHTIVPRSKGQGHDISLTRSVVKQTKAFWPTQLDREIFAEELTEFNCRIKYMLERISLLNRFTVVIQKSQNGNSISETSLLWLYNMHEMSPVSHNIGYFLEFLLEQKNQEYDERDDYDYYDEDYPVFGNQDEDEYDDDCYYRKKKTKGKGKKKIYVSIHQLCLTDIKKETDKLQDVKFLQKDRDEYCLYSICAFLNQKTSNDWSILSKILDFL